MGGEVDLWQSESPRGPDSTRQPALARCGKKCRTTNLFRKCQGFQLEASRRARVILSEPAGSALGTVPGAVTGNRSGGSASISVRFFHTVYTSSYTRHRAQEVLDDDSSQLLVAGQNGEMVPSRSNESCEGLGPASLTQEAAIHRPEVLDPVAGSTCPSGLFVEKQTYEELSEEEKEFLRALLENEIAPNTRKNYLSQWRIFQKWADERGVESRPAKPVQIVAYLTSRESRGVSPSTLRASVNAISYMHRIVDRPDPCATPQVRRILRAANRKPGWEKKQAPPLNEERFIEILKVARRPRIAKGGNLERPETALSRGNLDIAMIAMMRDGLLRVSEASDVIWGQLEGRSDGSGRLLIPRSKTDQEGEGAIAYLSIPTMSYLESIRDGASAGARVIGLRPNQIAMRIKRAAQQAGIGDDFSGHSCRVGMACDLARQKIDFTEIMKAGRWSSLEMVIYYTRSEVASWNAVSQYYGYRLRV